MIVCQERIGKTNFWHFILANEKLYGGIHTFQLLLLNSMKMFNKYSGQRKMSLYVYRLSVINALLPQNLPPDRSRHSFCHQIKKLLKLLPMGDSNVTCRQCTKNKKRTDSPWFCVTCPDKPGLCVSCFDNYHLELDV